MIISLAGEVQQNGRFLNILDEGSHIVDAHYRLYLSSFRLIRTQQMKILAGIGMVLQVLLTERRVQLSVPTILNWKTLSNL